MERTYMRSYLPFVEVAERHPSVRMGLHFSGTLLEWLAERHPEYLARIGEMVARHQVEMVGGGFYEPILIAIPREDQIEQIRRMKDFIEARFGAPPQGAWLTERVWEPHLPGVLADAGVEYTLVDDAHFLSTGREESELFGYYIAEERGRTVKVIPGLQELRYLIPFHAVEESIASLRGAATQHPGGMATMGDDMEKFGAWPHTWEHCYRNGWVENFFAALEANQDWLDVIVPGQALRARQPLGRAYLPTAAYMEMTEWFHALQGEFAGRPEVRRFLRGGFWRGFFTKYDEANLLHKKMLRVSSKLRARGRKRSRAGAGRAQAETHLLRAQCNDAYWHGIFGGLYAPHLRAALWRELLKAESYADAARIGSKSYREAERLDFDADGREEIEVISPEFAALVKPAGGGTLEMLDFRPRAVTLVNSMQRRVEAYHARVRDAAPRTDRVASIHEQTLAKEAGLDRWLRYDRWPRHTFRLLLFSPEKTQADYESITLQESAEFASGDYCVKDAAPERVTLAIDALLDPAISGGKPNDRLSVTKTLSFQTAAQSCGIGCRTELRYSSSEPGATVRFAAGLEIVLNLLAPNEPDRYFEFDGARHALVWSGVVEGAHLRVVDEWQDVAVEIKAPGAHHLWVAPIETVSESDEGFERVYQGSQILPVWNVEIPAGGQWNGETLLRISPAHASRRPQPK
jgi:4-alpha-glucanotransferase